MKKQQRSRSKTGRILGRKAGRRAGCLLLAGALAFGPVWRGEGIGSALAADSALSLDEESREWIRQAGEALQEIAEEREIMALVYLSDEFPIRREPSAEGETLITVPSGQLVYIQDVYVDEEYTVWEYVTLTAGGEEYAGYVPRQNLAVSDSRFLEWEQDYGMNPGVAVYAQEGEGSRSSADIEQFPESYREALYALKEQHPSWTFVKMNTTMDWNEVISSQLEDSRSLVYKSLPDWTKAGLYDSGNWYYATEAAVKMYMDPRNGLTEDRIFQFELLTYNEEYHTQEAISAFLDNTFMNGSQNAPGTIFTYAEIFWLVGQEEGRRVSPFHLAARVLQEQGQGTSPLISGTYPGYEGYYNYFNVSASGNTDQQVIESGLTYARNHGWDNAYNSIMGGADVISANYIRRGQDTLYLQKFNVNPNGYYRPHTHQYMQNITAPTTEALSMKRLYASADSLDSTFVFKIPVYDNMPETACGEPAESLTLILKAPEGYSDSTIWLDGAAYEAELRNGYYSLEAGNKTAKTAVAYKYNASGVPEGMYVWSLTYQNGAYTATEEPELENLLGVHGFSIRITGNAGMRFKSSISADTRAKLVSGGISGYTLKEYGTLIMNASNLNAYPMVKGGAKTDMGMAYGTDSSGEMRDVIYETVDGRYRYTSVLIGMPEERYKTEYAFRGYVTLEKDGEEITVYGPIRSRSLYDLAQQLLASNTYEPGTAPYQFLQQLIQAADRTETTVSSGDAAAY